MGECVTIPFFQVVNCVDRNTIEQQGFQLIQQVEETLQTDVWKARQVTLDRIVCLQILRPEFVRHQADRERFLAMARCLAKLKSESIASVFDIVSAGDLHYVVMEYVDGPTLEEALSAGAQPFPLKQVLHIASSLAFGFEQLWDSARVVHRNLKGATVRLDPRGVAKIIDFSLAFISKPGMDMAELDGGHIVGSPSFISPEYAQGESVLTTQSDMYAFGALLYTLATGRAPFGSLDAVDILESQMRAQIQPPHQLNSQMPVAFSWFIHRLMMKNPTNRYADWRAVRYDIKCLLNGIEPRCVRPDETYFSTILVQPMLDAMAAEEAEMEDETDTRRSIRLKQKARHNARWEEEHNRDIARGNVGTAVFMSLLLLAWFVFLFWFRGIWQPANPKAVGAPPPPAESSGVAEEPPIAIEVEVPPVETPTPVPPPAPTLAPTPVAAPTNLPPVAAPPPVRTNAPPAVAPERVVEMPRALRDALVVALKAGDLNGARRRLAEDASPFTRKEAMLEVLAAAPTMDAMIVAGARTKIGRSLAVNWKGRAINMVPRSISEGAIKVEVGERTHDLMIAELTPDERLIFLAEPKTEAEHLTYCLMLMGTSRHGEIAKFAEKCPPLKDVLLLAAAR